MANPASSVICRGETGQLRLHAVGQYALSVDTVCTMFSISPVLKNFPSNDLHVFVEGNTFGFERGLNRVGDAEAEIFERDGHYEKWAPLMLRRERRNWAALNKVLGLRRGALIAKIGCEFFEMLYARRCNVGCRDFLKGAV